MGQVHVNIDKRLFKIGCDEGEEQRLLRLAEHLGQHVERLKAGHGEASADQLYLMAGLMVCDELWDAHAQLVELQKGDGAAGEK